MSLESATYISELNSSNPTATDLEAQGDDHLRLLKATLQTTFPGSSKVTYIQQAQTDVASNTTCDIGAAASDYVRITGTTTITGLGTVAAGTRRIIRFEGALTFTYNATSLILPGAASITTAANDRCEAISLGSGNWIVTWFQRAVGTPVAAFASGTIQLFGNSTAPTGWTKGSTHNNKAIRIVTGTPSTGGDMDFTDALTSRTIAQANLPSVSFNVTGSIATAYTLEAVSNGTGATENLISALGAGGGSGAASFSLSAQSGGSGTGFNFAVKYVDFIIATKD